MKLVSLNIWGGMQFDALMEFVRSEAKDTDIFCFQEVFDTTTDFKTFGTARICRVNMLEEFREALSNFDSYFAPCQDGWTFDGFVDFPIAYGLAIFVRKGMKVEDVGEFYAYGRRNMRTAEQNDARSMGRNVQYLKIGLEDLSLTIGNVHGYWVRAPKTDTPERIAQSEKILDFLNKQTGDVILCGDFNLRPDTKSMAILETKMRNLIKEFGIKTTRNELYADLKIFNDYFADYVLVSSSIEIRNFQVPYVLASDHLPMILEFS